MTQIKITTDRLPQPARHKGAILVVSPEKAASMVAQGFAVIVAEADAPTEPEQAPAAAPEAAASAPEPAQAPEAPAEPEQAPAAAPAARRRRTEAPQ